MARRNEVENKIREVFAPLYHDVKISSNLEFNWDKNIKTTRTLSPPIADSETGLTLKKDTERQKVQNGTTNAEEGITANDNTAPEYDIGQTAPSTLDVNKGIVEYGYNEQEETTETSEGKLIPEKSSMVIAVYRYKQLEEDVLRKNGELDSISWEDFKLQQVTTTLDISEELKQAAIDGTGITNISFIGYEIPILTDSLVVPATYGSAIIWGLLFLLVILLAYGLIKVTKPDSITEIQPELSVEELLVSTQIQEQNEKDLVSLDPIEYNKELESKKQIEKFVTERPEAVAQLLRNWLNDEWE